MGSDGHIASLFHGAAALQERRRLAVVSYAPNTKARRITLTLPVLNNAAQVVFLVAGEAKAKALSSVFSNTPENDLLPAAMIEPENGHALWLIDRAAAGLLELEVLAESESDLRIRGKAMKLFVQKADQSPLRAHE